MRHLRHQKIRRHPRRRAIPRQAIALFCCYFFVLVTGKRSQCPGRARKTEAYDRIQRVRCNEQRRSKSHMNMNDSNHPMPREPRRPGARRHESNLLVLSLRSAFDPPSTTTRYPVESTLRWLDGCCKMDKFPFKSRGAESGTASRVAACGLARYETTDQTKQHRNGGNDRASARWQCLAPYTTAETRHSKLTSHFHLCLNPETDLLHVEQKACTEN